MGGRFILGNILKGMADDQQNGKSQLLPNPVRSLLHLQQDSDSSRVVQERLGEEIDIKNVNIKLPCISPIYIYLPRYPVCIAIYLKPRPRCVAENRTPLYNVDFPKKWFRHFLGCPAKRCNTVRDFRGWL